MTPPSTVPSPPNSPVLSIFGILPSQVVTRKTFLSLCSVGFSKKIISLSLLLIKIAKMQEEGRKGRGEGQTEREGERETECEHWLRTDVEDV